MTNDIPNPIAAENDTMTATQLLPATPDNAAPDYAALDAAHRSLSAQLHPANKADLFTVLAGAGIVTVTVAFDGYGDSGQIESIDAVGADEAPRELPQTSLMIRRSLRGEPEPTCEDMTAADAVERLAYDLLGDAHPGWEINDGAYGTFVFDVAAGVITLDCNLRFTASELHTSAF